MPNLILNRLNGDISKSYRYTQASVDLSATSKGPQASHHILIVDRSGSMWGSLDELKVLVKKLLSVHEYADPSMLISLISYSSSGDCRTHISRTPVNSIRLADVDGIRVSGLTCISQSLDVAKGLMKNGENTVVSLHSDGYANDRSSYDEMRQIDRAVQEIMATGIPVCINTIAYSAWSDVAMLDRIATNGSGKMVFARDLKTVYDAIKAGITLLEGSFQVATVEAEGASMMVVVDPKSEKILASTEASMRLAGVSEGATIYRFFELSERLASAPKMEDRVILSLTRAFLGLGKLGLAKQGLVASKRGDLYPHLKAIIPTDLGLFAAALESAIFHPTKTAAAHLETPGIPQGEATVVDIMRVLRKHRSEVLIHMPTLTGGYKRRSVKKVAGVRNADGSLTLPTYDTVRIESNPEWMKIDAVEVSSTRSTMNLRVAHPVKLVQRDTRSIVREVAGVPLDSLREYNNYTLVGDGEVLVPTLRIRVLNKKVWNELAAMGVVQGEFSSAAPVDLHLKDRWIIQEMDEVSLPEDFFEVQAKMKTIVSILSAFLQASSDTYTDEQVKAFTEHGLSKSLGINFPTTNHYADREEAISKGWIDSYTSYSIAVGNTSILQLSDLHSGNALFERFFALSADPKAKPKLAMLQVPTVPGVEYKKLSARTKMTPVDDLQKPIMEVFLGFGDKDALLPIFEAADLDAEDLETFAEGWKELSPENRVASLKLIQEKMEKAMASQSDLNVRPLAFAIGSTGMFPDDSAEAMDAEALKKSFPLLKVGKSASEGTYYRVGENHVLGVFPQTCWYTTAIGAKEIQGLPAED